MKIRTLISSALMVAGWWLATGVAWAEPPLPVPATGGLPKCKTDLSICTGDLNSCDLALGTCTTDLTMCDTDLGTCTTELTETTVDLVQCESDLANCQATAEGSFPASGQTSCWDSLGNLIDCAGTGQDGDMQAGATLSYKDNGDGTITDKNTKLMWEKKDDNNADPLDPLSIHNKDTSYTWADALTSDALTSDGRPGFLYTLNNTCNGEGVPCTANNQCGAGAACGFAGHRDWRVPNVRELHSIVHYEKGPAGLNPAVSDAFNTGCVAGCTVDACSCTGQGATWSSTSDADSPHRAWFVPFNYGGVYFSSKLQGNIVRAVRGGL